MSTNFARLRSLWSLDNENILKIVLLSIIYFLLNGCYTIWRPLKTALFSKVVGAQYAPDAKMYLIFVLAPLMFLYAKLVDSLHRHQVMYCFIGFFTVGGSVLYLLLLAPKLGLIGSLKSHPWIGWFLYFLMDAFGAFLGTSYWGFVDSVCNPEEAKRSYGFLTTGSKFGGALCAFGLYFALRFNDGCAEDMLAGAILVGCAMLILALWAMHCLVRYIPSDQMHGYEKVYQLELSRTIEAHKKPFSLKDTLMGVTEGFWTIMKTPYALGVAALVTVYEVVIVLIDYRVLLAADSVYATASLLAQYYALMFGSIHVAGILISLLFTIPVQRLVGVQTSLYFTPLLVMIFLVLGFYHGEPEIWWVVLVSIRSFNYAFNNPTREMLYIPANKAIKFKAKAWIDGFGTRVAKGAGSFINTRLRQATAAGAHLFTVGANFFLVIVWMAVSHFMGKTYQKAIEEQKVIGESDTL